MHTYTSFAETLHSKQYLSIRCSIHGWGKVNIINNYCKNKFCYIRYITSHVSHSPPTKSSKSFQFLGWGCKIIMTRTLDGMEEASILMSFHRHLKVNLAALLSRLFFLSNSISLFLSPLLSHQGKFKLWRAFRFYGDAIRECTLSSATEMSRGCFLFIWFPKFKVSLSMSLCWDEQKWKHGLIPNPQKTSH